jgi:preprotein translocase subunit SecA
VKRLLDLFGGEEMDEEPLSQRMVSRSIERAQRQVEEHNAEMRKHVLEYDEVMDKQRKYIYAMRRDVLENKDIRSRIDDMIKNVIEDAIELYAPEKQDPEEWDIDGLEEHCEKYFGIDVDTDAPGPDGKPLALMEAIDNAVRAEYARREAAAAEGIRANYREQIGGDESQIDFAQIARKHFHDIELMALLRAVDDRWIQHLQDMDYLRESVRLRALGQKDPLLEYKQEGFELFQDLVRGIEEATLQTIFRLTDPEFRKKREIAIQHGASANDDTLNQMGEYQYEYNAADKETDQSFSAFDTRRFDLAGQSAAAAQARDDSGGSSASQEDAKPKRVPVRKQVDIKPNDPCPCGSGKKYKKCCGRHGN